MQIKMIAGFFAATALLTGLAACGGTNSSTGSGNAAATSAAASPETNSAMTGQTFGAGCAAVPTDPTNAGSFDAMAKVPVATAASGNPLLSTLVTAVTKAQLADSLNSANGITVFAPTNDAFGKIPQATLAGVLANTSQLKSILTYHVVGQRLAPNQLAGTFKTLEGGTLTVSGSGTDFTVGGSAKVVCGNVQTANATVYIIDGVLMPKS